MTGTLVLPMAIANEIAEAAARERETAGVLLARWVPIEGGFRLLSRQMRWVPDEAYIERTRTQLLIRSEGYVPYLAEAEATGMVAIFVHTHPGQNACPKPSCHDEQVDREIADLFRLRTGSDIYGAAIFAVGPDGLTFSAHAGMTGASASVDRMWLVGDRFRLVPAYGMPAAGLSEIFDRNVRAFGGAVQRTLRSLKIGIAGCGGTGSAVAEQLVRLGVRDFTLVDPDALSESNITRVYGSTPDDVGRPKVEVLAGHIRRVAPDAACIAVMGMITSEPIARKLIGCDVVFGCTDDNAGRLVLSRLATYFLTPVIDCGVLLSSTDQDVLSGIDGRVTVLTPGQACLVCRNRVDMNRAGADLLTPEEHARLAGEGYAPALGRVEPAVVSFTTLVAATAVAELLERLVGYGPEPVPSEILLRCHDREISTNKASPMPGHYCDPPAGKWGMGLTSPFLEQTWPS